MNQHYSVPRTRRRVSAVRGFVLFVLLVAAGHFVWENGLPSATGLPAWILGLVSWQLKCLLLTISAVLVSITVVLWASSLWLMGPAAMKGAPTMLRLGRLSRVRQGWRNFSTFTLATLVLVGLAMIFDAGMLIFIAIYTACMALSDFVGSARIAGVVFLSRSSQPSLRFQVELKEAALGLRVVSLLDLDVEPDRELTRVLRWNVYRTSESAEWTELIQELMNLAQIIVLDARVSSPAVLRETEFALTPARRDKVLILTGEDGCAPVLDEFMESHDAALLRGLPRLTEIQLLAVIHRRVRSGLYPARMRGTPVTMACENTLAEEGGRADEQSRRMLVRHRGKEVAIPTTTVNPYTPAEMAIELGQLESVALHCDYPGESEELDTACRTISELLSSSSARWAGAEEDADALIWMQPGSDQKRFRYALGSPGDEERLMAAECGLGELAACVVTSVCEFFKPQETEVPASDVGDLVPLIRECNRALTGAMLLQDMEKVRLLMLELKVAIERLGSTNEEEAIASIAAAIADSAAAYERFGFGEAHALLESSIEAAANIGPAMLPMLTKGMNEPDPAVRTAFRRALGRVGNGS